jgi:hypothetical protein
MRPLADDLDRRYTLRSGVPGGHVDEHGHGAGNPGHGEGGPTPASPQPSEDHRSEGDDARDEPPEEGPSDRRSQQLAVPRPGG